MDRIAPLNQRWGSGNVLLLAKAFFVEKAVVKAFTLRGNHRATLRPANNYEVSYVI